MSRYIRQEGIIDQRVLSKLLITVIGIGAIGKTVSLLLAQMGAENVQIIDFDTVELVNLSPQGFREEDIDQLKTEVVAKHMSALNPHIHINSIASRFTRGLAVGQIVFCCVDDIRTRQFIWETISNKPTVRLFIDGRMSAESCRVLSIFDTKSSIYYPTTLFAAEDAYQEACTAKATAYCSNIAGGLLVGQLSKWLRDMLYEYDFYYNILSCESSILSRKVLQ